jgi:hypothetical protein
MLASARRRGEAEDVGAALAALTGAPGDGREPSRALLLASLLASLRQADHRLLAGEYREAWKEYAGLLRSHPGSGVAWMKMVRCVIFMSVPAAREMCFR